MKLYKNQNPGFQYSVIPKSPEPRCITDVIPGALLAAWSCKLATLENLTWQYTDTICDLCVQMRIPATKPLVRSVRNLKIEYDRIRQRCLDNEHIAEETIRGECFEDYFEDDFKKLFMGLSNDIARLGVTPGNAHLVLATQQALTLRDATKVFATYCDRQMQLRYGFRADDLCLLSAPFMALSGLLPLFAGDCYQPDLESRKITASILANRMRSIEVDVEDNGTMITLKEG